MAMVEITVDDGVDDVSPSPFRTDERTATGGPEQLANREVIHRESAQVLHGPSGNYVPAGGIAKVLLAPRDGTDDDPNGDVAYECNTCGKAYPSANSASAHRTSHTDRELAHYPESTIRALVRAVRIEEQRGNASRKAIFAANTLNSAGVPTLDGRPWTANRVSSVYVRWGDRVKVRVPKSGAPSVVNNVTPIVERTSEPSAVDAVMRLARSFDQTTHVVQNLEQALAAVAPMINELREAIKTGQVADAEIIEKAEMWDQVKRLFNK